MLDVRYIFHESVLGNGDELIPLSFSSLLPIGGFKRRDIKGLLRMV